MSALRLQVVLVSSLLLAPVGGAGAEETMAFTLRSAGFACGGAIPAQHTCEGADVSPPLAWTDPPAGTQSFALIVDDPDAPDPAAPKRVWVHWVVYDLPAGTRELAEGAAHGALPRGAVQGRNDWNRVGYGGPCPPIGRHRYFHKLYALDLVLGPRGALTKAELEKAIAGHVLAQAELIGTYQKAETGSHLRGR